jgi:hypothetical protein
MTDPTFLLALAAAVLSAASIILHLVAPKTKTTVDDQLRDDIDEVLAFIRGRAPAAAPPKPPIGPVAVLALVVLSLAGSQLACTAAQRAATGPALIDCTAANAPAIGATAASMRKDCAPAGTTSWACVEAHAGATLAAIGGCAFLEVLAGPAASAVAASSAPDPAGRAAFERYRTGRAGGATFRTAAGDR